MSGWTHILGTFQTDVLYMQGQTMTHTIHAKLDNDTDDTHRP